MSNPPIFQPGFDYSNWQATNPTRPQPGPQLDNDFANAARSINEAIEAVGDIRRSDGKLKNGIVTAESLNPSLSLGFSFEGTWQDGFEYGAGDGVVFNQVFYAAKVAHTASVANQPPSGDFWTLLFSLEDIVIAGALSMPSDSFVSNGVTREFTLSFTPVSARNLLVMIGGQIQATSEYSVSGNTLTFDDPPPVGPNGESYTIEVRGFATTGNLVTPADGSVTEPKLDPAFAATLPRTTLFSPGVLTGQLGAYRPHLEDYETSILSTADNSIIKLQAAIDANQSNVLILPDALMKWADTAYFWRSMDFIGARDENFWQEFGDSTGGTAHPRTGTIVCPLGPGVGRKWSDIGNSEDDLANTPMMAILANDIKITGLSLRMGLNGNAGWSEYVHVCGARGFQLDRFGAQGLGSVGAKRALVVDGTWSKFNTNILGTAGGGYNDGDPAFQHVREYIKAGRLDPNLMAAGPTDIKISEICLLAGVKTVVIQGRKGSFPAGQNPYGPNGISDFDCKANLYNDGPLLERMTDGGTVFIDYRLPGGNPTVNGVPGDNGQNIRFKGRLDPNAKYAVKISHGHKVLIDSPYLETGSSYQDAVAAYNLANGTTFNTRAIIETDETCTGEVAIVTPGPFVNIRSNGTDTAVLLRDFNIAPAFGKMIDFDGRQNGEFNGPKGRARGWLVDAIREIFSFEALGQVNFVRVLRTSRDSFFRARWKAVGKGEISTNGTDWLDYEKGVWTPALAGATVAGTNAYTLQVGEYTRIGDLVVATINLQVNGAVDAATAGAIRITGLPFTAKNANTASGGLQIDEQASMNLTAGTQLTGAVTQNTTFCVLSERGPVGDANLTSSTKFGTNARVRGRVTYLRQ